MGRASLETKLKSYASEQCLSPGVPPAQLVRQRRDECGVNLSVLILEPVGNRTGICLSVMLIHYLGLRKALHENFALFPGIFWRGFRYKYRLPTKTHHRCNVNGLLVYIIFDDDEGVQGRRSCRRLIPPWMREDFRHGDLPVLVLYLHYIPYFFLLCLLMWERWRWG